MSEMSLKELSDRATEGPLFVHDFAHPEVSSDPSPADVTLSCDHPATITVAFMGRAMTATLEEARGNAAYLCRLWNDHRDGRLHDDTALAIAVARARREGLEERAALKQVVLIQARELKRLDPQGSTPPDLDEAMDALRRALAATSPEDRQTETGAHDKHPDAPHLRVNLSTMRLAGEPPAIGNLEGEPRS